MTAADAGGEEARVCAVRFTRRALDDLDAAHARFEAVAGQDVAGIWKDGFSRRPPRLYRRPGSSVTCRILFTVLEASPDGPLIVILALRHGAQRPITRAEAHAIETGIP